MDSEEINLENQESYDDLFRKELLPDGFAGLKRLKFLRIRSCKTEECLVYAPATTIVFPVLEELHFFMLDTLREICRGPVPEGSFGELTSIEIRDCHSLEYLFPLQIVGCLTQLKRLTIQRCADMKEVIWKEQGYAHIPKGSFGNLTYIEIIDCNRLEYLFPLQIVGCLTQLKHLTIRSCRNMEEVIWKEQGDTHIAFFFSVLRKYNTHIATNGIEFQNLEFLDLGYLTNLVGFCKGIDQIDFPKLRCMHLEGFSKRLFDIKSSLSSNSEQNLDVGKQIFDSPNASSIFPQKVTFPCLEDLSLKWLGCKSYSELQISPLLTVKKLVVHFCYNLRYVFNSSMARHLVHLKELTISNCSEMYAVFDWEEEIEDGQERKVDTTLFPQLSKLQLNDLSNLRSLCRGPVPGGSFGELTSVEIIDCNNLENLFPLGCLTQLERLTIQECAKMKELIWKEQGDAHIATNGIEFRNLEFLDLQFLRSLVGFCTGIDQIDFPKLKCMHLRGLRQFNRLFDIKSSLSSNSDQNFDVGSLSLFPQKVTFPCLEDLILQGLHNWGDKYFSELLISSFPTVKKLEVSFFHGSRYVFHSSLAGHLVHLKELNISNCGGVEAVFGREDEIEDGQERKVDPTLFPQLLKLQLNDLQNLKRFCHFTHTLELPMLSELDIRGCPSMEEFSLGHVSTPNLSSPGISWNGDLNPDMSWNGDLNNALRLLQEFSEKRRKAERDADSFSDGETDWHSVVPDETDLDICDSESDSSIERNNNTITWRATLPPNPQRGRCICFRTADLYTDTSVITRLYSVPFDLFGDGGDDASSSNPDVEGLEPFYKCTDFATTSTLSSVGSSLFVVGGSKETGPCRVSITTEKMYRFDTTAPENGWNWYELSMCTPRAFPITVAMDGKLYIFGGSAPDAPLAELFDPCSETSVELRLPPGFQIKARRHLVVVALEPSKKILVASRLSLDAYVYDVVDQSWENLDHKVDFSSVRGQPAVFQNGNALCWCSNNVEEVHAYHLVHKSLFKSPIKGLEKVGMRDLDEPTHDCLIFPLDDNHLCLLWKDHMGYDGTNLPLLHCIKIQVSIDPKGSKFDAVVVASRTYALGPDESFFDAHVFLGDHDHGGRTWERSGYGDGPQTVSSIAPFKICFKCWGIGHTESGCDQVESAGPAQVLSARGLGLRHSKK